MKFTEKLLPYGAVPSKVQMDWYHRRTAFFHFTVNTFTGKEWGDGTESPNIFNPTELDCRQWISTIKKAGFSAAVLTAKHHDGFCLWPSKYTEHCIKNSPYKNGNGDIVREFVNACREFGVKPGLYLSPWDRNHKQWGTKEYSDYYANQLTELMTEYGEIFECWWDGAGSIEAVYEWERWVDIIRKNQPDCAIYGCQGAAPFVDVRWVGNELGYADENCYATIDEASVAKEIMPELNKGKADGDRFIPAECDVSIRPGWFYHKEQDDLVKTPEELVDYWFKSVGRNSAVMLNLPITDKGLVHNIDADNIITWEKYLREIFKENLLQNSTVNCDSVLHDDYNVDNIICEQEDKFYVSDSATPIITFDLPCDTEFNCIKLCEVIELGHRVRGYVVEYLNNGKWETLIERECIGFCHSEHFKRIKTNKLRIRITSSAAAPAIRFVGIYNAPDYTLAYTGKPKESICLTELPTCKITRCSDGFEIDFGGIFPYNKVFFNGEGVPRYEIFAFNGTNYISVFKGEKGANPELCFFKDVEGSYKMKLVLYDCEIGNDRAIRVLYE